MSSSRSRPEQALADLAQHLVAVVVAERVVDLLEAVEVEQHHGHARLGAPGDVDGVLGARAEEDAVGQAGQRVVQGEALGDERLAAGALDGDHRQRQERQQHRRRVEREDGQRGEAQEDALGGRLADELGGDLVAQAGAGGQRDGARDEARVDDEEDGGGGEDGGHVGGGELLVVGQDARGQQDAAGGGDGEHVLRDVEGAARGALAIDEVAEPRGGGHRDGGGGQARGQQQREGEGGRRSDLALAGAELDRDQLADDDGAEQDPHADRAVRGRAPTPWRTATETRSPSPDAMTACDVEAGAHAQRGGWREDGRAIAEAPRGRGALDAIGLAPLAPVAGRTRGALAVAGHHAA